MDNGGATSEDGRWLSYAELAELRGITRKAAIRLTQRHQWRRQPGNDGATRVYVPPDIERRQTPRDDATPDDFPAKALVILEAALAEANRRAEGALALADRTLAQLSDAAAEADTLREAIEGLRAKIARSEVLEARAATERDRADARAQAAEDVAEELRKAEATRQARGRWARLRAAWRGGVIAGH
jgi:hypothetical protein